MGGNAVGCVCVWAFFGFGGWELEFWEYILDGYIEWHFGGKGGRYIFTSCKLLRYLVTSDDLSSFAAVVGFVAACEESMAAVKQLRSLPVTKYCSDLRSDWNTRIDME